MGKTLKKLYRQITLLLLKIMKNYKPNTLLRKEINRMSVFIMYANDLLSKWGFGDGDRLSDFLYENNSKFGYKVDTHKLLEELVKRYLLPKIDKKVEIFYITTNHNPVRAEMIDGKYYQNHYEHDDEDLLGDVSIELTLEEVEAVAKEMSITQSKGGDR